MYMPLAAKIRPLTINEMVGQQHLIGKGKPLYEIIKSGIIPNMIFYGSSGVGKTTLAHIIAGAVNRPLYKLNATTASTGDIKDVISELNTLSGSDGVILYLDEIQYFTKKQQQVLLEFIENGSVTLIASTTENPYFYVYNAILSRCTVFEFYPVEKKDMEKAVNRAFESLEVEIQIDSGVVEHIAACCGGDVRKAINTVELLTTVKAGQKKVKVTLENAKALAQRSNMKYDRDGDMHYDILSAFQKSIRGSDPDAALHYLARLLKAGDLPSVCRRLLVIASEDIGLAYSQGISIVKACVDSALQLGIGEGRLPLAQAVILLATAPKSNSVVVAIDAAMADIENTDYGEIPKHLRDGHYSGAKKLGNAINYNYPHNYENNYVKQQYLPDNLKNKTYYRYGGNKSEQTAKAYWEKVKGTEKRSNGK